MKVRPGYLKRILGGAIFGLYMGQLVFFLNPQIDMTAGRLTIVCGTYAAIWGLLLGSLLWLLRVARVRLFGRPEGEYKPHGFGYIVAASLISTATFWGHLVFFRVFLPPAAVAALSNATIILGTATFILLLLWLLERQLDARVPSLALWIATLIVGMSVVIPQQRQDRYVDPTAPVGTTILTARDLRPVTLVVVDGLPYDWVVTLDGEDVIPQLESLMRDGFLARVHPFNTSSARALSASLATGKLPNRHRVTGRWSYRTLLNRNDPWLNIPRGVSFRNWGLIPPVDRISAPLPSGSAMPVWRMRARPEQRAAVVGWPFAHGSLEPFVLGISQRACVDADAASTEGVRATLTKNCEEMAGVDPKFRLRLEPAGAEAARRILDSLKSDRAAAWTALSEAASPDLVLVTISISVLRTTVDAINIRDNRLPASGSTAGDTIRAVVGQIDRLVADIDGLRPDDTLMVVSHSGPAPPPLPSNPVAAVRELLETEVAPGREDGFILISGEVKASREASPIVAVVDVVPTALLAAGMPIARDLDGRIITEAFEGSSLVSRGVSYIQSYEHLTPQN